MSVHTNTPPIDDDAIIAFYCIRYESLVGRLGACNRQIAAASNVVRRICAAVDVTVRIYALVFDACSFGACCVVTKAERPWLIAFSINDANSSGVSAMSRCNQSWIVAAIPFAMKM